jgi:hypothetical protein
MLLHTRVLTAWVAANVVASATFLHFASWAWLEPDLRGEDVARGGDALVWMMSAFPVLIGAVFANALWLVLVERERRKTKAAWPVSATVLIAVAWASTLTVDHLRSAGLWSGTPLDGITVTAY